MKYSPCGPLYDSLASQSIMVDTIQEQSVQSLNHPRLVIGDWRLVIRSLNGRGFKVAPLMPSTSRSSTEPKLKLCNNWVRIRNNSNLASLSPRQILFPAENGMKFTLEVWNCPFSSRNLSGWNSYACFQILSSWFIAYMLKMTVVFFGMSYPPREVASIAFLGTPKGVNELRRNTSQMVACRYGSLFLSIIVGCFVPITASSSLCNLSCFLGHFDK